MSRQMVVETSSGAVVYKTVDEDIKVLLVRPLEHRDSWGIPKGHLENTESLSQTAIREVYEEAGIKISLEDALSPVYARYNRKPKRVHAFLAQQVDDVEPHALDGENFAVAWHSITALPTLHFYQVSLFEEAVPLLEFKVKGVVPANIMERFDVVFSYASKLDDWIEIKKLVVAQCAPRWRKLFSRRHEFTNMQQTNCLEHHLGKIWSERTGRPINWPKVHVDPI